jgi:hypothetical protein
MRLIYSLGLSIFCPILLSAQITIQIASVNVQCFGGNNGVAQAVVLGGTPPYSYIWNNGAQTKIINDLSAGTYTVTVTDNAGATATQSSAVTQPPPLGATLNGQPQLCNIAPDGFAYTIPMGGVPPYSFSWNNGVHTQLNNFVTANTYSVTVTDNKGCTATGSYTVGYLGIGLYLFTETVEAVCPNPYDGEASVLALSGTGPYTYAWNNDANTKEITHLSAGEYVVTVTDSKGCSATKTALVERKDVDSSYVQILEPQCSGQRINLESSPEYQVYEWSTSDPSDEILDGNGTHAAIIKWGLPGHKQVNVSISDPATQCATKTLFEAVVYECAVDTESPTLNQPNVSPNPFVDFLQVQGLKTGDQISLYNIQGSLVFEQSIEAEEAQLQTSQLLPGAYLLRISNQSDSKTWKLLKK